MATPMTRNIRRAGFAGLTLAVACLASPAAQAVEPELLGAVTVTAARPRETTVGRTSSGVPVVLYELSHRVSYGDLDLAQDGGAQALRQRVHDAAKFVCADLDKLYPLTESDRYCAQEAEQAATAEVDAAIAAARRK
jgi:UrcA family protein